MNTLNIQMEQCNKHIIDIKRNLFNLQEQQKKGSYYRDLLLVNQTTNNINYIDELENIVSELKYLEVQSLRTTPKFEIPYIPAYSPAKRTITDEIIKRQEKKINKLEKSFFNNSLYHVQ